MLALDEELLKEYFAFQKGKKSDYTKEVIEKLFKYLQSFTISIQQKNAINLSDEIVKSLTDSGLIKVRNRSTEDELIQKTLLKVMLTTSSVNGTFPYPYINILDDEVDVSFTATYKSGDNRDKAKEHIKALLSDANEISIYDRYLSKINQNNDSWSINKLTLLDILPQKDIIINIYCEYNWDNNRENDLISVFSEWIINKENFDRNIHDRYIETDKVIILLSSGIINLSSITKDFTYIIKVK